jgi:hypothetical protein
VKAPETTAAPTAMEPASSGWSIDGAVLILGGLMLFGLAAITGVISYQHGLEVTRAAGAVGIVVYLVPLVADLLIAASSLSILDAARHGGGRPVFAWISLVVGVVVTVVMNVAAAWHHGTGPRLLNAVAPVALILSYETLMSMIRRARDRALAKVEPNQPEAVLNQCPHLPAKTAEDAPVVAFLHARDCMDERPTLRQHAATWGVNRAALSERLKKVEEPTESGPAREPALNGSGPA